MLLSANKTLAQFLRSEMDRRGIVSTYDLATAIGVSQGTAWRLLDGRRVPREETLVRIARAFDVPLTDVRDMAERPTGEPETFRVPSEFNQLTARERDAIVELGWCLLAARAERRVTR
jgi:transcriptional regulator with XRE-family HTH domain